MDWFFWGKLELVSAHDQTMGKYPCSGDGIFPKKYQPIELWNQHQIADFTGCWDSTIIEMVVHNWIQPDLLLVGPPFKTTPMVFLECLKRIEEIQPTEDRMKLCFVSWDFKGN